MKTLMPEPEAFRFDYDGYGWSYRDNGSGSSWKDMEAPDKEFMFTESQLRAAMVAAFNEAIEHCARLSEGHYGDGQRLAEIIRTYKETP